jgi:hypothetical protein
MDPSGRKTGALRVPGPIAVAGSHRRSLRHSISDPKQKKRTQTNPLKLSFGFSSSCSEFLEIEPIEAILPVFRWLERNQARFSQIQDGTRQDLPEAAPPSPPKRLCHPVGTSSRDPIPAAEAAKPECCFVSEGWPTGVMSRTRICHQRSPGSQRGEASRQNLRSRPRSRSAQKPNLGAAAPARLERALAGDGAILLARFGQIWPDTEARKGGRSSLGLIFEGAR